jgi:endogenous inhibitor of DNA gyrase (YacG/DUF329 family)
MGREIDPMSANDNNSLSRRPGARKKHPTCPICGKPRDKHYDPFCSRRCADVDLHRWLTGSYVIPGGNAEREPSDEE